MSDNKWTAEQLNAINQDECNLLVAAAAGAGKTAVLVERIIRKITHAENPIDVDRLLIVTFTNAAAAEMRERISDAIAEALDKNPTSPNIQKQMALLGKSSIITIHSFCLDVIRNNFQIIDIDPNFRITDETENSLMKLEALDELFEKQYEIENVDFLELLECYGGNRDDKILCDIVLNLYSFIQSNAWPLEWLDEMTEKFNILNNGDFGETIWGQILMNSVKLELSDIKNMLEEAINIIAGNADLIKYLDTYKVDLCNIQILIDNSNTWDSIFVALQNIEFSKLPSIISDIETDKKDYVKKIRDNVKTQIKKIRERIVQVNSEEAYKDLSELYPNLKCLSSLVKDFSDIYKQKKRKKAVLDFNDLEHFCLEILSDKGDDNSITPSKIALSYKEKFSEIMVDEYQDSNMVQENIINMISKESQNQPNVFMVGDVKQSIYRFRQAKPELFMHKYNTYSADNLTPYRKILLYKNFRSRREVVDAVNFIFMQIMSQTVGELDYTNLEKLNTGADYELNEFEFQKVGGETELHIIQTTDNAGSSYSGEDTSEETEDTENEDEELLDRIQSEARFVGKRIRELINVDENGENFSIFDKNSKIYRKAEYRDIVILLRTTKNWSVVFADELTKLGIPVFSDTGTGFFKTIEIQVVLSLLQIIDNPLQDIAMLSVLRSPIVGITTDQLAKIRITDKKSSFYQCLVKTAETADSEISAKADTFIKNLKNWREISLHLTTDQLIWHLYNQTGYFGMVGAMPNGKQRQSNLRILFERARQFEETSYKGLFNFISFIDKLIVSKGDMGSAKILGENDNVVRYYEHSQKQRVGISCCHSFGVRKKI